MQVLETPAVLDEVSGQPIQKLRVGWRIAFHAKFARRTNDAFAEVMMPNAVDHHPGGQGILGIGQDFRERCAPASLLNLCRLRIEYLQKPGLNFFSWLVEGALRENESLRRFGPKVHHAAADGKITRMQVGEFVELRFE